MLKEVWVSSWTRMTTAICHLTEDEATSAKVNKLLNSTYFLNSSFIYVILDGNGVPREWTRTAFITVYQRKRDKGGKYCIY